jgi:2-polyprenyl-3-methyl-5-hydroxy-6-metoxy-1,4-benzoquinol methylase
MNIKSPLTDSTEVVLEKSIPCQQLIDSYKSSLQIDTEKYFSGLKEIQLYKCKQTGYRFYYPYTVSGDGKFYEQLQKYDWYYMKWKWEHEVAKRLIKPGDKVLEVGSGNSAFVEQLSQEGIACTGLELNEHAISEAQQRGLDVRNESIQQHTLSNKNTYDLVCSFQVAEHISDIKSFLEASVNAIKPGGKLIISVPNNDSFLGLDYNLLNMPPHHMGLWNQVSLTNLQSILNVKLIQLHFEPLQTYHIDYYNTVMKKVKRDYAKKISKNLILNKVLGNYKHMLIEYMINIRYPNVKNFTVLADYIKA